MSIIRRRALMQATPAKAGDLYPDHFFFNWRYGADPDNPNRIKLGINGIKWHVDSLIVDGVPVDLTQNPIQYKSAVDFIEGTKDYHEIYMHVLPLNRAETVQIMGDTIVRLPNNSHLVDADGIIKTMIGLDGENGSVIFLDPVPPKGTDAIKFTYRNSNNQLISDYRMNIVNGTTTHIANIYIPKGSLADYTPRLNPTALAITQER